MTMTTWVGEDDSKGKDRDGDEYEEKVRVS